MGTIDCNIFLMFMLKDAQITYQVKQKTWAKKQRNDFATSNSAMSLKTYSRRKQVTLKKQQVKFYMMSTE